MEFLKLRPHEQNKLILEPHHAMFQSLRRHLKGVRINVKSTSRQGSVATRTIRDLDSRGAMYEFVDRDGRRITVAVCRLGTAIFEPHGRCSLGPLQKDAQHRHPVSEDSICCSLQA